MTEQRILTRIALLKVLYDIEHGEWPSLVDKKGIQGEPVPFVDDMGTSGNTLIQYTQKLFPNVKQTPDQIVADIDYLLQKHLITNKPENPLRRNKVDKFKLLWYTITAYGKDIVEGVRKEPSMPAIRQNIVHIENVSNSSIAIDNYNSDINQTINSNNHNSINELLNQINAEIMALPQEHKQIADSLTSQLKGEILLEPEQQEKTIIIGNLKRINDWLTGLGPVAGNITKLIELFKELGKLIG